MRRRPARPAPFKERSPLAWKTEQKSTRFAVGYRCVGRWVVTTNSATCRWLWLQIRRSSMESRNCFHIHVHHTVMEIRMSVVASSPQETKGQVLGNEIVQLREW